MRLYHLSFALFLMACSEPQVQIERVVPDLPAELRAPVEVPKRKANTLADVGVILTDHVEALKKANGQIEAIDCIWTAAEENRNPDAGACM